MSGKMSLNKSEYVCTLNLQRLLFLLSFVMYSVGDGLTAVYMMEKKGVMSEINPIVRFVYDSYGGLGVVSIKMFYAFVILFFVWRISKGKNTYWAVTGFLLALFIGGIMLSFANLMTANDMIPQSAISITFTFLSLALFFILVGEMKDKLHA